MVHLKFQKEWKFEATTILTQGALMFSHHANGSLSDF